ncbi:MAG: hypothetical protein R3C45_04180 [Phycisphaerales bacterium]
MRPRPAALHPGVSLFATCVRPSSSSRWRSLPGESLEEHLQRLSVEAGFDDYLPLPDDSDLQDRRENRDG